jgi:F420H(2)-dependent quinone reductase
LHGDVVYVLSGGADRSDWVRNLRHDAAVTFRLGDETRATTAQIVTDPEEGELARDLLVTKYRPRYGGELEGWRRTALPIAIAWGSVDG